MSLAANAAGLVVIVACSSSAVKSAVNHMRSKASYEAICEVYEDQDGQASSESMERFSDRPQRATSALLTLIGTMVTLSRAVLTTSRPGTTFMLEQWLQFAAWVLLLVQSGAILTEPVSTIRFRLGCQVAIACVFQTAMVFAEMLAQYECLQTERTQLILATAQSVLSLLIGSVDLLLPRRPDVLRNGTVVDRQFTTSALRRLTFSWAEPLLNLVVQKRGVDLKDLHELDSDTRSNTLQATFAAQQTRNVQAGTSRKLWVTMILCHRSAIILQLILAVILSFLSFVPQITLWGTLKALETQSHDTVWLWVLGLGLSMVLSSTVDAWLTWISYSGLNIKIMEQLAAVIFDNAIRRKDVKEAARPRPESEELPAKGRRSDDSDATKTHQSTINLVAVDTKRVADFAASNFLLYQCPLKLAMSCVILAYLVGWQGLLAGITVLIILTPLNGQVARKYAGSQSRIMKARDNKMAVITEALQGIQQIKFAALERQWEDKINACRTVELRAQWQTFIWSAVMLFLFILGPLGLSAASLSVYAWINGGLSASVAFTAVTVFASIEVALASFPESLSALIDSLVSLRRIETFLNTPENTCKMVPGDEIEFADATVAWPSDKEATDDRFLLRNLTFKFPKAGLSIISGPTGSGKSLLLASIVGECEVLTGAIKGPPRPAFQACFDGNGGKWIIESAMAFMSQMPWIENATIKDNILFGLPYDHTRYQDVMFACALEKDLDSLSDGDLTEIGAQGVNISGGQKWRISLARALYSRAGILVMDDVFSAVDAHTARHLFDHAVTGKLAQGRTRILVTHHTALCLPGTDYAVRLNQGGLCYAGKDELQHDGEPPISPVQGLDADSAKPLPTLDGDNSSPLTSLKRPSRNQEHDDSKPVRKFVQDEGRATGATKWKVYRGYLAQSGSVYLWEVALVLYLAYSGLMMARAWWINVWTSQSGHQPVPEHAMSVMHYTIHHSTVKGQAGYDLHFYIAVYVGMSLLACIIGALRSFFVLFLSLRASRNMFHHLLHTVLRAPLRWLNTVPLGRILNRFTADFNTVDSVMGVVLGNTVFNAIEVIGTVVAGSLVNPILALFTGFIVLVSLAYSRKYLAAAREIKRLESTAKSPIFVQFDSVLNGLATIRGFGKVAVYIQRMQATIDRHAQAYWHLWLLNRWLAYRMNMMGSVFTIVTATLVISAKGINASMAGFAISFALRYTSIISRATQIYSTLELSLNSVERIQEYSEIPTEDYDGIEPPAAWPTQGHLEVFDLVASYASDLSPVLQGLNFHAEPNQRIGVVGRTGAGKSSLALTLFRFLQIRQGQIFVDGIDISKIKLHHLRSRLAIIPQDPVLFSGTVRSNLDPFDEHDDLELRGALERVNWSGNFTIHNSSDSDSNFSDTQAATAVEESLTEGEFVKSASPLDLPISEGGRDLSQGQRQLLCLARAMVFRPKIMVLDEATSAVDKGTDELIQQSIRTEFGRNSTLLVIAHRISTVADFDRILVLDSGKAVEFGSPRELMEITGGVFRRLVEESGEQSVLEKTIFGQHTP